MPQADLPNAVPRVRRRAFRRRLRTRIILSFFLLGFCLTALFAWLTDVARQRVENQLVEDVMNRNIDASARQFYADPSKPPQVGVQQILAFAYPAEKFDKVRQEKPEWAKLPDGIYPFTDIENGEPFSYKLAVRKTPQAWFFLAYDTSQATRSAAKLRQWLYLAVLLFGAGSLLIGWWSAARVMSPVSDLARRLRAYRGQENPKPLANYFPEDEVGELARALDDYAEQLTERVQRDREFNNDVSHELRTPLAVIRGATELLLSSPNLDDKLHTRLLRIQRAEQQCTDLIGSLLLLSRNERGAGHTTVSKLVEQLLDSHRAQLGGKQLDLRVEGESGLVVDAPEAALSVALGNLIGNAVKYTQQGEVCVRLRGDAVDVIDTGPGLSAEDAARLFERGYRGSHAGNSQGGGIGLSIVSRLCELYDWQVEIRPRDDGTRGVVATLSFSAGATIPTASAGPG